MELRNLGFKCCNYFIEFWNGGLWDFNALNIFKSKQISKTRGVLKCWFLKLKRGKFGHLSKALVFLADASKMFFDALKIVLGNIQNIFLNALNVLKRNIFEKNGGDDENL